jgi:hypothetical protein
VLIRLPARLAPCVALMAATLLGQSSLGQSSAPVSGSVPVPAVPAAAADSAAPVTEIQPDLADPAVIRARQNLDRIRPLVQQGALPVNSLSKAQDDLQDALDNSILRYSAYTSDLLPDQAEQMVIVAERMLLRRRKQVIQAQRLAESGVISRAEAQSSGADVLSAELAVNLATERAQLVQEIAQSLRMQKSLAEVETEAESHPEWNGQVYTRYDGNGVFTRGDFDKLSAAYHTAFGRIIPVSADGQTAVHRSLGLNHTGRVDIALRPDQPEGIWLLRYLEKNHIPYYAFRAAVARKSTGAHIHLGPGSTRLVSRK